jgi:hypothetical protein
MAELYEMASTVALQQVRLEHLINN